MVERIVQDDGPAIHHSLGMGISNTIRSSAELTEPAVRLVASWLERATELETRTDRATMNRLRDLITDDDGVDFVMGFVDRVARPDSNAVAAHQLGSLVRASTLPDFLSPIDKAMLKIGARLAPLLPSLVMPLARRRMRGIVGHLVAPSEPDRLVKHLQRQRADGFATNVNLLGEAVLGEREAEARLGQLMELLEVPDIDYVSVKISAVASQLNHWAYDDSLRRVTERVALLVDKAAAVSSSTFVNFDMEDYSDLELTVQAFKEVLSEPTRTSFDAGIVLQAYLPDVFETMTDLVQWANQRHSAGGGTIKIRLVKGANLAMERVDAALHGWEQTPYLTKLDCDANYKHCLDWALTADRLIGVRIGVASHNLFDVAWAKLLADERGVADRVQFEMLQGMASAQAAAVDEATAREAGSSMLLYTPAVGGDDFDVAIGYLFRRLEENASSQNFLRSLFDLSPDSPQFDEQAELFRQAMARRDEVASGPARTQNRDLAREPVAIDQPFRNEPDTDPSLKANRLWVERIVASEIMECTTPVATSLIEIDALVTGTRAAGERWRQVSAGERRIVLHRAAHELAERRSELISAMMHEASKVISEADAEVSEAIDFARWYADRAPDLETIEGASFEPLGLIAVVPPWNFPVAIPAGGVLASLAAGNSVVFKPAPETPRCAEIVAEACWAAGVPNDVLRFVRTPDDAVGRRIIESADAIILTGSTSTADLFRTWKPAIRLFGETSGKNALIITPNADLDLAAQDLVRSAFGHAGQKCSAASLAILVGDVYSSERFRSQLVDAVESLTLGSATDLSTDIAPMVGGINDRLTHAVESLDHGERWLVEPRRIGDLVTPGLRDGVTVDSWFHRTECFGPVLGLMAANSLEEAIAIANSSEFGLTGGIHSLDPAEVASWCDAVEVGNGYVNRAITGAIVQRQPFGGWKASSVGPGAKAGGPNYLMQLGTWTTEPIEIDAADDYQRWWDSHFAIEHDDTDLFCEANIFRYRPLSKIAVRVGLGTAESDLALVRLAASLSGTEIISSSAEHETQDEFASRLESLGVERVRVLGETPSKALRIAAVAAGVHLADDQVTNSGRIELQHYVREQAISITLHRFGNVAHTFNPSKLLLQ
ncbi:MAG: bifunctional proline dehydrogenase/L-glutamate gamma-semialdehyde dehydrogenase [Acidimicrobiales bacterium]